MALVLQTSAMSEKNLYERGSKGTRSGKGDRNSFLKFPSLENPLIQML